MNDAQRDELLIRLDERTLTISRRLDALPCDRCGAFFTILRLFGNRYALATLVLLFAIVASLAHAGFPIVDLRGENGSANALYTLRAHPCTLRRVIDGDTLSVNLSSAVVTIRLLGIDTPEAHHPQKHVQPYGPEATRFAILWLGHEPLILTFDPRPHPATSTAAPSPTSIAAATAAASTPISSRPASRERCLSTHARASRSSNTSNKAPRPAASASGHCTPRHGGN